MTSWEDAFEIRKSDTWDLYKRGTDIMISYFSSEEEAIRNAKYYFSLAEKIIEDQLFDLLGEEEGNDMRVTDQFVLFYGSVFSQWYHHVMTVDGVKYNTAEQYMMAMKAKHFGDEDVYEQIMETDSPSLQKSLGRQVKNFDPVEWSRVSRDYVFKANLAKFSDPILKQKILDTGDREIVEAGPTDKIWGIGLGENDPRALDKTQWQGTNWLGEVLMKVRETLR